MKRREFITLLGGAAFKTANALGIEVPPTCSPAPTRLLND